MSKVSVWYYAAGSLREFSFWTKEPRDNNELEQIAWEILKRGNVDVRLVDIEVVQRPINRIQ